MIFANIFNDFIILKDWMSNIKKYIHDYYNISKKYIHKFNFVESINKDKERICYYFK